MKTILYAVFGCFIGSAIGTVIYDLSRPMYTYEWTAIVEYSNGDIDTVKAIGKTPIVNGNLDLSMQGCLLTSYESEIICCSVRSFRVIDIIELSKQ